MFDKLIDLLIQTWEHFKPILFIMPYDKGVIYRGGRFKKVLNSGSWYLRIPFIDDFHTENIMLDTMNIHEVNITTLDGQTISIGCEFDLRVTDIVKAVVETNDWRTNLVDISRGEMSNYVEECNWEEIKKKTTKNAIERKIQKRADEMGIEISNFNFTDKAKSRLIKLFNNG